LENHDLCKGNSHTPVVCPSTEIGADHENVPDYRNDHGFPVVR
jgi:hypothetical protein